MTHFTSMMGELGRAGQDARQIFSRQSLKRFAVRSSPVLVFAAVGAGALCVKKMRDPPDADFVGSRASFQCKQVQRLAARQDVADAGGDVAALCRAARRMRGPIERDLVAAECLLEGSAGEVPASSLERAARALGLEVSAALALGRRQLFAKLVETWHAAGYFAEQVECKRPRPSNWVDRNPATGEDESYGRDVGSEVPLCMLRNPEELQAVPHHPGSAQWGPALDALQEHGLVILKNFLPKPQVLELRQQLCMVPSVLDVKSQRKFEGAGAIREYDTEPLEEADPELQYIYTSIGRRSFILRGRQLEEVVREVQAGALPLVWEHLMAESPSPSASSSPPRRPYVSEVQLLVTEPGALDQFWHIDNAARGLTLFVPLTPLQEDMGPNLFVPGSHHFFEHERGKADRVQSCASSLLAGQNVTKATMVPGDALLYDSRVIHRGDRNRRYDRTGIALVFRYDFERPPGYGATGTLLVAGAGRFLSGIMSVYSKLPG